MPCLWLSRLWLTLPLLLLCAAAPAPGQSPGPGPGPGIGAVTKLPVPRFVSLRSDQVNFRAGPGFQYPVTWVYQRAGLPVEIIGEFDVWRQLLAPDGGTGWVHEATLRSRRDFYISLPQVVLRNGASDDAGTAAILKQGDSGLLLRCDKGADYCKVSIDSRTGYLARSDFWGVFDGETVAP
jgi:SH3-like domain-containing protein